MTHEKRYVLLDRQFRAIENDIRETIQRIYGTPQRQASDALALVVLGLFIGTIAILANLFVYLE